MTLLRLLKPQNNYVKFLRLSILSYFHWNALMWKYVRCMKSCLWSLMVQLIWAMQIWILRVMGFLCMFCNGYNDFIEFFKSVIKDILSVSLFLHRKYKGCCAGYFWNVSIEKCEGMVVTGRFPFNRQYQCSQHC